jgi:hypothetical protein
MYGKIIDNRYKGYTNNGTKVPNRLGKVLKYPAKFFRLQENLISPTGITNA